MFDSQAKPYLNSRGMELRSTVSTGATLNVVFSPPALMIVVFCFGTLWAQAQVELVVKQPVLLHPWLALWLGSLAVQVRNEALVLFGSVRLRWPT